MEGFRKDLKHSIRMFVSNPGFTLSAVAALMLGIGANTAIFSVVNAVLIKPLPYPAPDDLVNFMTISPAGPGPRASAAKYNFWKQQTGAFQDVSAYKYGVFNLTGVAEPEQIQSAQVSSDFFRLFGLPITRGRSFLPEEDRPHARDVAILSDGFWNRVFGGDPQIIGKTISLSGSPYEVIGVMAPGAQLDRDPPIDAWTPFQIDPNSADLNEYFLVSGRLKPGVTFAKAKAQIQLSAEDFRRRFPTAITMRPESSFGIQQMQDAVVGEVRLSLLVLLGAVSFVLLIACANVANLLLVRATARKREMAIRSAVGASRGRIIRQLLAESVMLSLVGGILGLVFGLAGVRALLALNRVSIPRIGQHGATVTADWRVIVFTLLISLATGILFGLVPALQSSRSSLNIALKESSGHSGSSFRQNKTGSVFTVIEVMLALVLLVGAGLLIRTFVKLRSVDPGFDPKNLLTVKLSLTDPRFRKTTEVAQFVEDGTRRINALPGVEGAATTFYLPLEGGPSLPFVIAGRPLAGPSHGLAHWVMISPAFFDVFKVPVQRGRAFTEHDDATAPGVAIINETMARQFWPGGDPLSDRIMPGSRNSPPRSALQIVGVVGDVRGDGLSRTPLPTMYVPLAQVPDDGNAFVVRLGPIAWAVRTRVEPHTISSAIQNELRQASGGLPIASAVSMSEILSKNTGRQEFNMLLLTIFGCSALLLAAIGIYGLMAYSVQQRTQEIGIRMALGAEKDAVRNMVVVQGMRLALVGVILGVVAAFGLTRLMGSFLFGVKPWDPIAFISMALLLTVIALLAIWLPAHRATKVDPVTALRYE